MNPALVQIPAPDKKIYRAQGISAGERIIRDSHVLDGGESYLIEKITEKPLLIHYKGCDHPRKGWPTGEAVASMNQVKKTIMEYVKLMPPVFSLKKVVKAFNEVSHHFYYFTLEEDQMMECSKEFQSTAFRFLTALGVSEFDATYCSLYLSHIVEYDMAYRFRLQDVLEETNYEKLFQNPRREIGKLMRIAEERESDERLKKNIRKFSSLRFILLIPKFKKAFRKCLGDIRKMQYDQSDKYWVSIRDETYRYFGKTHAENMIGKTLPFVSSWYIIKAPDSMQNK